MTLPGQKGLSNDLPSRYVRIASAWFVILGIVGLLLVGLSGDPRALFWMEIDPVSSGLHLAVGLVGVAMSTTPPRARRFAMVIGPALVVWAVLALVTDGSLGDWATSDAQTVGMHLVIGVAGVAAAWAPPLESLSSGRR